MFVTGLLGGFGHCIGMCGPVVATYSISLGEGRALAHLLYNFGRITTYSILGGIIGLTGSFLAVTRHIEKLQTASIAIIGCVMIVMGLSIAGLGRFFSSAGLGADSRPGAFVLRCMKLISEARGIGVYYPMGLVLGFIPCGLLYSALIAAAGMGAAAGTRVEGLLSGMAMLFLFGLGTTPALFLIGHLAPIINTRVRGRLYKASGIMMIATGVIFIHRALQ